MEVVGGACVTSQSVRAQGVEAELPSYGYRQGHWPSSHCLVSSIAPF